MRAIYLAVTLLSLGGFAAAQPVDNIPNDPSPFPVQRGTAPPPPQETPRQSAPVEGVAEGGVDFGQWRSAPPIAYEQSFRVQILQRLAGKDAAAAQADLERNGFACETAQRLDCRIEISERQCAYDWYVVIEPAEPQPVVGFETLCMGAR